MKKLSILIFVGSLWLGCKQNHNEKPNVDTLSSNNNNERVDQRFDSSMNDLLTRGNYDHQFKPSDSSSLSELYPLRERSYFPNYYNLTFDLRDLNQTSEDFAPVIHVYNDSLQCIVPFTDLQYYIYSATNGKNYDKFLNFEVELNRSLKSLGFKEKSEIVNFLDHLMQLFKMDRISIDIEYELYQVKNKYHRETTKKRDKCLEEIELNNDFVKNNYKNASTLFYSNGAIIFYFYLTESNYIKTKILNNSCAVYFSI